MRVILGSSSKWRRSLAKKYLGLDVELLPADIDERKVAKDFNPQTPQDHTSIIARAKLEHLLSLSTTDQNRNGNPVIIICCDTIVYYNGQILEKPIDHDDCVKMIKSWDKKDCRIEVYTAIAVGSVYGPKGNPITISLSEVERADVVMTRDLKDEEIEPYIQASDCLQSSGALIIENLMDMKASVIDGDQTVIEGLPISKAKQMIDEIKVKIDKK